MQEYFRKKKEIHIYGTPKSQKSRETRFHSRKLGFTPDKLGFLARKLGFTLAKWGLRTRN